LYWTSTSRTSERPQSHMARFPSMEAANRALTIKTHHIGPQPSSVLSAPAVRWPPCKSPRAWTGRYGGSAESLAPLPPCDIAGKSQGLLSRTAGSDGASQPKRNHVPGARGSATSTASTGYQKLFPISNQPQSKSDDSWLILMTPQSCNAAIITETFACSDHHSYFDSKFV